MLHYLDFKKLEIEIDKNQDGLYFIDLRCYDGEVLLSYEGFKTKKEALKALKNKLYKY